MIYSLAHFACFPIYRAGLCETTRFFFPPAHTQNGQLEDCEELCLKFKIQQILKISPEWLTAHFRNVLTIGLEDNLAGLTGSQYDNAFNPRVGGKLGIWSQVTVDQAETWI